MARKSLPVIKMSPNSQIHVVVPHREKSSTAVTMKSLAHTIPPASKPVCSYMQTSNYNEKPLN